MTTQVWDMGLMWSQKEMSSGLPAFIPQGYNEDMVPHPPDLICQMYSGCTAWFPAQVKMWRVAQLLFHYSSACSGPFGTWHFALSAFSMCNSNSYLFAIHFGPFVCQLYFKEGLLGCFYSSGL